ncbi:MAG: ATP-binding cassette domain-containing protein, partial [Deltaproteobacteria bacterium]
MPAIKVENLSKEYVIDGRAGQADTLREQITSIFRPSVLRRYAGKLRQERFWALKDVSFEVNPGEVVGIIGRNGAGKSTLLKILSRITEPTKGQAELYGRVSSLLEVGTGFHPELSGRENIFLNGSLLGMRRQEIAKRVDEIVAFSEIERFIDMPIKRYSSGMYVRLAFAVAAHLEPEILIVDEVLAVGDALFQKKCIGKMADAGREGRTILFVSHNLIAVRAMCGRVLLLEGGKVAADGDPAATIAVYVGGAGRSVLIREWPDPATAPQNATAVLRRVSVRGEDGEVPGSVFTDVPFRIEVEYEVKENGGFIGLNLIFYDSENVCVLASINNHEPNWYGKPMPAGSYRSVCRIPKNLLNNGGFTVSVVLLGKNYTDSVVVGETITLDVQDGTEVRGDYYGGYGCPI